MLGDQRQPETANQTASLARFLTRIRTRYPSAMIIPTRLLLSNWCRIQSTTNRTQAALAIPACMLAKLGAVDQAWARQCLRLGFQLLPQLPLLLLVLMEVVYCHPGPPTPSPCNTLTCLCTKTVSVAAVGRRWFGVLSAVPRHPVQSELHGSCRAQRQAEQQIPGVHCVLTPHCTCMACMADCAGKSL